MIEPDNRILKFDRWFLAPFKLFKVPFTGDGSMHNGAYFRDTVKEDIN